MADYYMADGPNDPGTLAERIVDQYHPHLKGLEIAYVFKVTAPKKKKEGGRQKKVTMARASKVPESVKPLLAKPYEFRIEFDAVIWDEIGEIPGKREALVDHELSHCGNDADGTYMIPHSVEEFDIILKRHGLWKSDVENFAHTVDEVLHPGLAPEALVQDEEQVLDTEILHGAYELGAANEY